MSTLTINCRNIQERCARWHQIAFPDRSLDRLFAKTVEELGEVAKALVGEEEDRPGRGDVVSECADTILCLITIVGQHYPERNILSEVVRTLIQLEDKEGIS